MSEAELMYRAHTAYEGFMKAHDLDPFYDRWLAEYRLFNRRLHEEYGSAYHSYSREEIETLVAEWLLLGGRHE